MNNAREYFGLAAERYDNEFNEGSIWSVAHRTARHLLAGHMTARPNAVADVGCGTGTWGLHYLREGIRTTFIDPAVQMLKEVERRIGESGLLHHYETIEAPVESLAAIPDSVYDLTLCMGDPLSYSADWKSGISELSRITCSQGLIFVSVDSRYGYLRVFAERDGFDLERLGSYLSDGNAVSWENLDIHTFTEVELREAFEHHKVETLGIWALPTVSSFFLTYPNFAGKLAEPEFRRKLDLIELEACRNGAPSPGIHHLYGMFRVN